MTGRIALDAEAIDGTARELRAIGGELDNFEKQLVRDLAEGVPARMKADVVGTLVDVRKGVERKAHSSRSQAGELKIRAVLTRLAAGEGTTRDVAVLLSLCAGPKAIDPKKRPGIYAAIIGLQNAAFSGPILARGAGQRTPNDVDKAMTRWARWMGRGALEKRPFGKGTLSHVRDVVLGKKVQVAEMTGPLISNPGQWPSDPAAPVPDPIVNKPAEMSGGVALAAVIAGQRPAERPILVTKPLILSPDKRQRFAAAR